MSFNRGLYFFKILLFCYSDSRVFPAFVPYLMLSSVPTEPTRDRGTGP